MLEKTKRIRELYKRYWSQGDLNLDEGFELETTVLELCDMVEEKCK